MFHRSPSLCRVSHGIPAEPAIELRQRWLCFARSLHPGPCLALSAAARWPHELEKPNPDLGRGGEVSLASGLLLESPFPSP